MKGLLIVLSVSVRLSRPKYTSYFTRTLAYVHSRTRSLAKYTSFDSPGLAGPVRSSYEYYSVTKDTEEKLRIPVSTAERLAVTKYCCKLPFGKPDRV